MQVDQGRHGTLIICSFGGYSIDCLMEVTADYVGKLFENQFVIWLSLFKIPGVYTCKYFISFSRRHFLVFSSLSSVGLLKISRSTHAISQLD